jgi:hypothetical protein
LVVKPEMVYPSLPATSWKETNRPRGIIHVRRRRKKKKKTEGKRTVGRPRYRWSGGIRMDRSEVWTGCIWPRIGTSGRMV